MSFDHLGPPPASEDDYGAAPATGSRRKLEPKWTDRVHGFQRDANSKLMSTVENVGLWLENDPALAGLLGYDTIADRTAIRRHVPGFPEEGAFPMGLQGHHVTRLQRHLQRNGMARVGRDDIRNVADDVGRRHMFNPIADYVNALPEWDKVFRMDRLFEHYFSAKHDGPTFPAAFGGAHLVNLNEYLANLSRWFLAGLVRRALKPGCQMDYMPVLVGKTGLRKSTGLAALVPRQWFSDELPHLSQKERDWKRFYKTLRGSWLIEAGELRAFEGISTDDAKNFLSIKIDRYTPMYGSEQVDQHRLTIFAGTTNKVEFLHDPTGNRRYWPIAVDGIVKVDEIERDREQLLAEALYHVRFCEKYLGGAFDEHDGYYPSKEWEREFLAPVQEAHMEIDIECDRVAEWLNGPAAHMVKVTAAQIADGVKLIRPGQSAIAVSKRLGEIMRKLRWTQGEADRNKVRPWLRPSS